MPRVVRAMGSDHQPVAKAISIAVPLHFLKSLDIAHPAFYPSHGLMFHEKISGTCFVYGERARQRGGAPSSQSRPTASTAIRWKRVACYATVRR